MSVLGYEISTDRDRVDVDVVFRFLSEESYWAFGIPRDVVERSIDNSLCFGVYQGEALVGFARIVTDRATFALVADVFILEPHRGKGLSKGLMHEVMNYPALQGLRRLILFTSDAHTLYEQFGFAPIGDVRRVMEVVRPDIYQRSQPFAEME